MSSLEDFGTEEPGHVADLMDAAHADRAAREEHGRAAVNAGPSGADVGDAPSNGEPAPLGWHGPEDYGMTDDSPPERPAWQVMGQGG